MEQRDFWKMWLIGMLPDAGLSWAFMKFSDDKLSSFWWCLLALTAVQTFFVVKQIAAGSLIFHFFSRDRISEVMTTAMQKEKFPPPEKDEDFESFMYRLVNDEALPARTRVRASLVLGEFLATKQTGFFVSLRMTTAADLAAKKYFESF